MAYCKIQKIAGAERDEKWWSTVEAKKGQKWETMRHNGVLFPEPYEPLPKNIKVLYKGKPVSLNATDTDNRFNITAEEAAVMFASKLEQDERTGKEKGKKAINDPTFTTNFWKDWKVILGPDHPIKDLKNVDFSPLQKYIVERAEMKKSAKSALEKEAKLSLKEQKEAIKELYGYAVIDGVRIGMSTGIQPPGIYMSHANSPLRGSLKKRIQPKDIVLNVSKKYIPQCYIGGKPCKWGDVVEKRDVTWIAGYRHPLLEKMVYIWLKRDESHWVCADDMAKFDKARKLGENIEDVRSGYTKDLTSSSMETKQLATAVYLLDVLAVRPGTDKDETKESDTLGLTTLKCNNIRFGEDGKITFDFAGKSGVQFTKTKRLDATVYKNLKKLCSGKAGTAKIFPDINATSLNGYLKTLMPGLTAKVFRTYKANSVLQRELDKHIPEKDDAMHEKKLMFDRANIEVAKALNHKNMTSSEAKVEKIRDKIKELEEKKKKSTTPKQKAAAQKSIDLQEGKLEQASGNIATSTSRVNYIDARIVVAWCKKHDVAIEKIYNKSQNKKFVWSMDTPPDFKF
jgi:DNA topoisomerase I